MAGAGAILAGAAGVAAVLVLVAAAATRDAFSTQMVMHVAAMNVAAPVGAILLARTWPALALLRLDRLLWVATLFQLVALCAFHLPSTSVAARAAEHLHLPHAALFACAFVFWLAVVSASRRAWEAVLALLITGKLACLLGTLLVFAPQPLYGAAGAQSAQRLLGDQQLAGLIMIAACPLSYVVAAIGITAQAIAASGQTGRHTARSP